MVHGIWGERFFSDREAPAWHGIGINSSIPRTAREAYTQLGPYEIELRQLYTEMNNSLTQIPYKTIVRLPTSTDFAEVMFGTPVSEDFELITPDEAVDLWDANVTDKRGKPVPVSTFGVLNDGARLFITAKLPGFNVKGDEIDNYLVFDCPFNNNKVYSVVTSPVRVVCQNTLAMALGAAVQRKEVIHTHGAHKFLGLWLGQVYGNATETAALMKEKMTVLANKPVKAIQVEWIVEHTYPLPKQPNPESRSRLSWGERVKAWEYQKGYVETVRETVLGLYHGEGTGMDRAAVKGTAFGAVNAVSEYETYRYNVGDSFALNLVNGDRAQKIRSAFHFAEEVG